MKSVSDIAQNKQKAEQAQAAQAIEAKEQNRKKLIPLSALIFANIVFLSLDVRALDAVYAITQNGLLAFVTVIVSGVAALYWWDFLYPHARRHRNKAQETISQIGVSTGVCVSLTLAFLDYIVRAATFDPVWLWGAVVLLTGIQGMMLARFWQIDGMIEADAKREESIASRIDLQDTAADFKAEIESMETLLEKLEEIKKKFPGRGEATKAARAMGYQILAEMLDDADGDGVPNYRDPDYKRSGKPQEMRRPAFAETISNAPPAQHEFTLAELLKFLGKSADEAEVREMLDDNGLDTADRTWTALRSRFPQGLTRKNFNRLFDELTSPNA